MLHAMKTTGVENYVSTRSINVTTEDIISKLHGRQKRPDEVI